MGINQRDKIVYSIFREVCNMRVYCATCDKYSHLMLGFAHQFNKYWGKEQIVDILGFSQPIDKLPDNFIFHSMESVETRPWTNNLHSYLSTQSDPYFTFLLEDYWLKEPVDQTKVDIMEQEVIRGAIKGDLSENTAYFKHTDYNDNLVIASPNACYRTSTQPCIWKSKFMIDLLVPGLDPWQFELQNNPAIVDGRIVGPKEQIYKYANVMYKGKPHHYMIDLISKEDMFELKSIGAFKNVPGYE